MRLIITGNSKDGLSTVIQDGPPDTFLVFDPAEDLIVTEPHLVSTDPGTPGDKGCSSAMLWLTEEGAPAIDVSANVGAHADFIRLGPGGTRWILLRYGAFAYASPHWSTTLDYDYIVSGSGQLILDECTVEVETGDCIILKAVRHAWRAGPEGMVLNIVMTGIAAGDEAG